MLKTKREIGIFMLICIELLPGLPVEWDEGEGLVARGGFVVDMKWKNGKLISAKITSPIGGDCKIKYGSKTKELKTDAGKSYAIEI